MIMIGRIRKMKLNLIIRHQRVTSTPFHLEIDKTHANLTALYYGFESNLPLLCASFDVSLVLQRPHFHFIRSLYWS